jgi:agmatine deiminase
MTDAVAIPSTPSSATPAALGYRFPAEWESHAATWLSWPHNRASWPGKFEPVPAVWVELTRIIAEFEPVHILAGGQAVMAEARRLVGGLPNVHLHDIATNDAWTRDHGPMFLVGGPPANGITCTTSPSPPCGEGRGEGESPSRTPPTPLPPALVDWEYNAWGGKYPPYDDDNRVPGRIAELLGYRRFQPGVVMEGGAVDSNGRGTILASELCLLNPNRNPTLRQADMERYLCDYLGARHVLWIDGTMAGDDTDGHVDQLARFVNPTTLVAAVEDDPADANYQSLRANLAALRKMKDQDGRPLEVLTLPMPRPIYFNGQRLPAGYLNFYIANGVVVVPVYGDPADKVVLERLAELFPGRQIRPLYAVDLVLGLGAVHCVTQQQPSA